MNRLKLHFYQSWKSYLEYWRIQGTQTSSRHLSLSPCSLSAITADTVFSRSEEQKDGRFLLLSCRNWEAKYPSARTTRNIGGELSWLLFDVWLSALSVLQKTFTNLASQRREWHRWSSFRCPRLSLYDKWRRRNKNVAFTTKYQSIANMPNLPLASTQLKPSETSYY